jgi:hypothetical protein
LSAARQVRLAELVKFLIIKYLSLALVSARALLLAALLGPIAYGVLGSLVLTQQYLSYVALGVREGLAVKLAQAHEHDQVVSLCSSALFWAWCVGALIICSSFVVVYGLGLGNSNWIWATVIASLSITNEMFININREQTRILRVAVLDFIFNCVPLAAALLFFRNITVPIALKSLALGTLISVGIYAIGMADFRWSAVRSRVTAELLATGVPLALMSFVMTSLTAVFVLSANVMHLGKTVGLLVFANSSCVVLLFGLNMAAWAATSKSMKRLHQTNSDGGQSEQGARLQMFLRFGIICSASLLLGLKFVFMFALQAYSGSEAFAIYLCLLQAFGLLLYRELNYLAVRFRSLLVAACYGVMLLIIFGLATFETQMGLIRLLQLSILLMFLFSVGCVYYCRHLGFVDRSRGSQLIFLLFPVLFAFGFRVMQEMGAAAVGLAYVILSMVLYKNDLRALISQIPAS